MRAGHEYLQNRPHSPWEAPLEGRSSGGYPASSEAHAPVDGAAPLPACTPLRSAVTCAGSHPWGRESVVVQVERRHWRRAAQGHRLHAGDLLWVTGQPHPVVFSTWTSTVSTGMTRTDRRLHPFSLSPLAPKAGPRCPRLLTARFLATTAIGKQPSRGGLPTGE